MQIQGLLRKLETEHTTSGRAVKNNLLIQKQGRDAHPERKGMGMPASEEEHSKEAVKSF